MNNNLENIKKYRQFLLAQISGLTLEHLNKIPAGYNNNIIWNLGHLVAATQAICYKRAGLMITIDDKYFTPFLTNTKPESLITSEEVEIIKELLISRPLKTYFSAGYKKREPEDKVFDYKNDILQ